MKNCDISVIIVSYNAADCLTRCLGSLRRHTGNLLVEVIVIDNASTDASVARVKEIFPGTILIENTENVGFARAVNQGIERARGRYCTLLNPDTELTSDIFSPILDYMESHSRIGAVGCSLLFPGGRSQKSYFRFPTLSGRLFYLTGMKRVLDTFDRRRLSGSGPDSLEVAVVSGACFTVKRDVIVSLGKFDPDYFLYHEEADVCFRLRKAGYRNVVLPRLSLVHEGWNIETPAHPFVYFHRNRSLLLYFMKHRSRFSLGLLVAANIAFLSLRILCGVIPLGTKPEREKRRSVHTVVCTMNSQCLRLVFRKHETPVSPESTNTR